MNQSDYFDRSRELQLSPRCPLVGYCERWAATVYLNTYMGKSLNPDETLFDRLKQEQELPPDFDRRRIASVCDLPIRASSDESDFGSRLCPEVALFNSDHRISSLPREAISSYRLSKYGSLSAVEYKHFSECLELTQANHEFDVDTSKKSDIELQPVSTILLLSANPKGTSQLRLDEEKREIEASIKERSRLRDKFHLISKPAVRHRDFRRAMLDHQPNFVHFSGHGHGERGIVLEDDKGYAHPVDADALASLFALYSGHVECVLLNSCYSKAQAQAIAKHVPFVIGMSAGISDRAAIEFAVAFYDAVGNGSNVDFAYRHALVAIQMEGIPQSHIPVLHERVDPAAEIRKYEQT